MTDTPDLKNGQPELPVPPVASQHTDDVLPQNLTPHDSKVIQRYVKLYAPSNASIGGNKIGGMLLGSSSTNSIPTATPTKVNLSTASFSNGVTADTSNNRLTILTAGYYQVSGNFYLATPTSGKFYEVMIYVSGSFVLGSIYHAAAATALAPHTSGLLNLAVGDYVELYIQHNKGSDESISGNSNLVYLSVTLT